MLVWCANDRSDLNNGWDVHGRLFSSAGVGGTTFIVNTHLFGDQYSPRIASLGYEYLISWTSLGQDGSREGVFDQFVHNDGTPVGGEFLVNTTTAGQQMQSSVAADGVSQFLSVWTSFTGSPNNFDLFAQRYMNVASILQPMSAPCVWAPFVVSNAVYQPQLVVTWPPLLGLSVASYEVYVDGSGGPAAVVTNNSWTMTAANGLTVSSAHSFQLDYVTTDGRRSPISPAATGTTWGGLYSGGIPSEWMTEYYGGDVSKWPSASLQLAPGMTLFQVFQSGGNPLDPSTWLHQQVAKTAQGMFLYWNTQPGATYQVQVSTDFNSWNNLGSARFAAGSSDSINIGGGSAGYYRVVLLR